MAGSAFTLSCLERLRTIDNICTVLNMTERVGEEIMEGPREESKIELVRRVSNRVVSRVRPQDRKVCRRMLQHGCLTNTARRTWVISSQLCEFSCFELRVAPHQPAREFDSNSLSPRFAETATAGCSRSAPNDASRISVYKLRLLLCHQGETPE